MRTIRARRSKGLTDYKARLNLLKSGKPRLVVRKSNRYIIAQIVLTEIAQDKVLVGVSSKNLLEYGWPQEKAGSLKSREAAYLTGYLIGSLASKKIKEAIFDLGMNRNIQKSRIYAVLKGAVDSGLSIPHKEESLPKIEELNKKKQEFDLVLNKLAKGKN